MRDYNYKTLKFIQMSNRKTKDYENKTQINVNNKYHE